MPTISNVSPRILNTQPVGQTQQITIFGTNFTSSTTLTFNNGSTDYTGRVPIFDDPTQLRYNIGVGPNQNTWTVKVANGGVESLPFSFSVTEATNLTGLSISGPATVNENGTAQFTATATFSDGSAAVVLPTWNVSSGVASINESGVLSAGSVSNDTALTVTASYMSDDITRTATKSTTILNSTSNGSTTQELIVNGGFEQETTGWSLGSATVKVNGLVPHSGNNYAILGEVDNTVDVLYQQFTIPASATTVTLSYYLNITSYEGTAAEFDKIDTSLRDPGGNLLVAIDHKSNKDKAAGGGNPYYVLKTFDVSAWRGQTVRFHVVATTDSDTLTSFKLDDVSVAAVLPGSTAASIAVTCSASPSSVSPGDPITVSGAASYNIGGSVTSGTATISLNGTTWTAAITNGTYNRQITVPSSPGNYSVGVTVADGIGRTGTASTSVVVTSNGSPSGYVINDLLTCQTVDSNDPYMWDRGIDAFGSDESQFYVWLGLGNVSGIHSVNYKLYRPDGSYYGAVTESVGENGMTYDWWRTWACWDINGYDIPYYPGRWDIKVYIDGSYQRSVSFTMRCELTEHRMAKDVQSSYPYNPIQTTNTFTQTDQKALVWVKFLDMSEAIDVKWTFYEPNGAQYLETICLGTAPSDDYWLDYEFWGWIDIPGNAAAAKCGDWTVDVSIKDPAGNWSKQYTDYFRIVESPAQAPSWSVTLTPAAPLPGQAITVTAIATDNTYLKDVVLHWKDASEHTHAWSNLNYGSFNQNWNIGSFSDGQFVEYWTVTTDTSGNSSESSHKSVVVRYPDVVLTPSAGENGTVTPATPLSLAYAGSVTFTANPDAGYVVDRWTVNGTLVQTGGTTLILTNITANKVVAVSFKLMTFTITPSAGANGSISPSTAQTVEYGHGTSFTAIPGTGYIVDSWSADGVVAQAGGATLVLSNITASKTISVSFKRTFTILPSAGDNGSISPNTAQTVEYGHGTSFTATPVTGYVVDIWSVDGVVAQTGGATLVLSNITASKVISVSFKVMTFTITPSVGADGSGSPGAPQTVIYGGNARFTATPVAGYVVDHWLVNDSTAQYGGNSFLLTNVTENTSVAVCFVEVLSLIGKPEVSIEGGFLTLTVTRSTAVDIDVEVSGDLATWQSGSGNVAILENTPTRLKARDNAPVASNPMRYIRLQVTVPEPTAPTITQQPVSKAILTGTSTTLDVAVQGTGCSYQWENGPPSGPFRVISGANSSSYATPPLTVDAAYRVIITNAYGSVVSEATLVWPTTLLAISSHPQNQIVNQGQNATFSVSIAGAPISYQWKKGGISIVGATTSSLTLSNVQSADAGEYTVTVTGVLNTITSNPALLSVLLPQNWVSAFGVGSNGQLGDGTTTQHTTPVAVDMSGVLLGKTVTMIAAGTGHSLALTMDGKVFAWGSNNVGQLGDGTTTQHTTPVAVDMSGVLLGKTVTMIAAGSAHSLVITSDGKVFAWGSNDYGQLGKGTTTYSTTPVAVNMSGVLLGKTVTMIAAGSAHSLALTSDGKVFAWGYNFLGQLGDSTTTYRTTPVAVNMSGVLSGKTVSSITAGSSHSLALTSDGMVFGWGYNISGQLGDGTTTQRTTPVAVNMNGVLLGKIVVMIGAGERHSLALTSDGKVFAWGNNEGQLGDGTTTQRTTPVAVNMSGVLSGKSVVAISAGNYHSLLIVSP